MTRLLQICFVVILEWAEYAKNLENNNHFGHIPEYLFQFGLGPIKIGME